MSDSKKMKSSFLNMALVLTAITAVSATLLGIVFNQTASRVLMASENKELQAITEVLKPGFDNKPNTETATVNDESGTPLTLYLAKKDGELSSIAVKSYTKKAYSGDIWLIAGFELDGTIVKIKVLDQKETPGLGTKITEDGFKTQYFGKNPSTFNIDVKNDGGEIDAVTAATISSRAYSDAVKRAHAALTEYLKSQQGGK